MYDWWIPVLYNIFIIVSDESFRRISFLIEDPEEQLICTEDFGYQ